MDLQTMINCLTFNNNVHICIHDISGLLTHPYLNISSKYKIHTKELCNTAKSTENGMKLCITCKIMSNHKSIREKELFIGKCPLGVTECVQPIVINGIVLAVIYIGNIIEDENEFYKRIEKVSKITGVSEEKLKSLSESLCYMNNREHLIQMAKLLESYIKLLYNSYKIPTNPKTHWAVDSIINYATLYYNKNIKLSQLAKLYHINENYIGRVFKQKTGMSFSNYLNDLRIRWACEMLSRTDNTIMDIALGTGFNNVTYFNKLFKKVINKTPMEYRHEIKPGKSTLFRKYY